MKLLWEMRSRRQLRTGWPCTESEMKTDDFMGGDDGADRSDASAAWIDMMCSE